MDQRQDLPTNIVRNVTDHSPAALWTTYNALHPSSAAASNTTETSSRVPKACETCRRRKRKCDGASPCSWCCKNNIECIFVLERPKRKKQDSEVVSNLEDQLLALRDYVRKLEATCGYTNLPLFDLSTLNESSIGQHDAGSKVSSDIMSHETDKTDCEQNDDTHVSAINDVSSMMWRMNIHGSGETSFVGPSGSFCFPSTRHGKSEGYSANIASSTHQVSVINNPLEAEGSNRILLDLFSQHINPVHKFVPASVVQVLGIPQASLDLELLQVSVLAAASILTDNPKLQKLGQQYADRAETIVMHCCRTLPNVSTARALSILSWRELGLENENNAWLYNSMAASLTLHLGLHVSSFENVVQMPIEKQNNEDSFFETDMSHVRIQTFWSIFLMDRIATSMLGRNCMLPWRRVRATPYLKACLANPSLEDTVFNSLCQMWFIHDRYMDKIYSFEFDEIESVERHRLLIEARDHHMAFFSQLGKDLELKKNNMNCKVILLHMVYHMSLLLIHRPYLIEPKDSAPHRLSVRTNITASHALVKLIRQYGKEGSLQHAPFFAVHCVLTAAVSLLLNATSTNPTVRSQSVHRFRVCVNALEEMQKTWPRAKRGLFLLRELANRWKVVSALPLRHSVPIGTETVGASYSEAPNDTMLNNATGVGGSVTHKDNDETQLDWGMLFANLEEPLDLASIDLSTPNGDWLFTEANGDEALGTYEGSPMSDI